MENDTRTNREAPTRTAQSEGGESAAPGGLLGRDSAAEMLIRAGLLGSGENLTPSDAGGGAEAPGAGAAGETPARRGEADAPPAELPEGASADDTGAAAAEAGAGDGSGENDLSQNDDSASEVQRRINKLTAARKSAEERLAAERERADKLAGEVARLQEHLVQSGAAGSEPMPEYLKKVSTPEELLKMRQNFLEFRQWARKNPDGGTYNGEEWDGDRVTAAMEQVEMALDPEVGLLQKRKQQLLARGRVEQFQRQLRPQVEAKFPWLKDAEDPRHARYEQAMQLNPWAKQLPLGQEWVAVLVEHYYTLERGRQAAQSAQAKAPPRAPGPAAGAPPRKAGPGWQGEALKRFQESGSRDDLAALLAADFEKG